MESRQKGALTFPVIISWLSESVQFKTLDTFICVNIVAIESMYYISHPSQMFFLFTFGQYFEMGPRYVVQVCLGLMVLLLRF